MKKRQILALLLVCVMMVGLLPVTPASATEASDPLDVVIVFDRSSAMDEDILTCTENHTHSTGALSGCYETRMAVAKRTAKDLITEIIDQNDNAKVAIVTFAKEATVAYHLTSVKTILRSTINVTTKSHKAANIEAGLVTATNSITCKKTAERAPTAPSSSFPPDKPSIITIRSTSSRLAQVSS